MTTGNTKATKKNSFGTREQLLGCSGKRFTEVVLGDTTFRLQSLTEGEKSRFEKSILSKKGVIRDDARRRLLVRTLVDEDGNRILTDADISALAELDGAITAKLFDAAMEHVGFQADEIDELVGNSRAIHGD